MTGRLLRGVVSLGLILSAHRAVAQTPMVSAVAIRGASDSSLVRYVKVKVGTPSDPETIRFSIRGSFQMAGIENLPPPAPSKGRAVKGGPRG